MDSWQLYTGIFAQIAHRTSHMVENRDCHTHLNQIPVIDFNIGPWPPRMWGWGYIRVKWTR